MKTIRTLFFATLFLLPAALRAQDGAEAFAPIIKYLERGDAESLSAWFDDSLEISIDGVANDSSRKQATQILTNFFTTVHPTSFTIQHAASKSNMKYALGVLQEGKSSYSVTIFVSFKDNGYRVQQLKLEKIR